MDDLIQRDERDEVNEKHAANPQPGDYWHEMLVPVCVVLGVVSGSVIYCDAKKEVGHRRWTWDLTIKKTKSLADFREWLEYDTIPGSFWARCEPGAHSWAVEQ